MARAEPEDDWLLRARRVLDDLNRPATATFIALTVGAGWLFWFALWRADYQNFFPNCNHDPGAALRTDEIVALGARPGVDFFYYYGLLPILACRAFFGVFGRSPTSLLALLAAVGVVFAAGLTNIVRAFRPTRLGAILVAVAISHAIAPGIPTHALEASILIWAVALRIRGHNTAAQALAVGAMFVKISMASVMTVELAGLAVLDAIRARSMRPLVPLLAIPAALAAGLALCGGMFGREALAASFDPRAGAAVYRAYDLGFFREGRSFWAPAGHTLGWYLGGLPGPWIAASAILIFLASRGVLRLVRAALAGTPRDAEMVSEETYAVTGFANLAFIMAFFAPSASCIYYYTWVLLVGVVPLLARAHLGPSNEGSARMWTFATGGWAILTLGLLLSTKTVVSQFAGFVREPRVRVGEVSMPVDEAQEWKETLDAAHSVGAGSVAVVARAANFGLADRSLREARYWMMLRGMRKTPSLDELLALVRSSDTIFVTKHDYSQILGIPEFHRFLTTSERVHDGKYFVLLRSTSGSMDSP